MQSDLSKIAENAQQFPDTERLRQARKKDAVDHLERAGCNVTDEGQRLTVVHEGKQCFVYPEPGRNVAYTIRIGQSENLASFRVQKAEDIISIIQNNGRVATIANATEERALKAADGQE